MSDMLRIQEKWKIPNETPWTSTEMPLHPKRELIKPPQDVLSELIPLNIRDGWRARPTEELTKRLRYLCASGPAPSEDGRYKYMLRDRAKRAAWETYLYSAFACGFFEEPKGSDLRGRLESREHSDFRSAIAECMTCWFIASKLHFPVYPDAKGRGQKVLDMRIVADQQDIGVEVKAPYTAPEQGKTVWGHDGLHLAAAMTAANKQFDKGVPNLLVLAPQLRRPVYSLREQLTTAVYGEMKLTMPYDMSRGCAAGPIEMEFSREGKLLQRRKPNGKTVKPDGMPGFTRISAVLVIEETGPHFGGGRTEAWFGHSALVAHNPYAEHDLAPRLFGEFVQDLGDGYGWSDGEPI